jgi:predicted secreted protein
MQSKKQKVGKMNKLTSRLPFRKSKKPKRITDSNIEEHREEVIARGKKFKYPFQYAKHRLVITTVIIGVVAVALFSAFGWLQLYQLQNMSDIVYRFTRTIPVPVAQVDGTYVRYSDYLMLFRSSIRAVENQQGTLTDSEEDTQLRNQYKRQALDSAIQFTFALKLASELGIEITEEQISEVMREHRTVDGVERSEAAFAEIISHNFGLSLREYERLLLLSLTKKEVSVRIDDNAARLADEVDRLLAGNNNDLAAVAKILGEDVTYEETGDMVDEMNLDGGRAAVAATLQVNQVSERFVSKNGDGLFFVKLTSHSNGQVGYSSIWIPFTEFNRRMQALSESGKIREFIRLE